MLARRGRRDSLIAVPHGPPPRGWAFFVAQTRQINYDKDTIKSGGAMDQPTQPAAQAADELTENDLLSKDILELMGAGDMPQEQKRNLYTKMMETINNRVIDRIAAELTPADREQWKTLAEGGDQAKMVHFFETHNIDPNALMLQEAMLYKAELTELVKPLQQAVNGQPNQA